MYRSVFKSHHRYKKKAASNSQQMTKIKKRMAGTHGKVPQPHPKSFMPTVRKHEPDLSKKLYSPNTAWMGN
jgi:hypothetical protein